EDGIRDFHVTGVQTCALPILRARQWILDHGGLSRVRVFTRYWLALIGEWPWEHTPNVPPEVIANPKWFPFNIYNFASWARATLLDRKSGVEGQSVETRPRRTL